MATTNSTVLAVARCGNEKIGWLPLVEQRFLVTVRLPIIGISSRSQED
jgi:hypothetical protein